MNKENTVKNKQKSTAKTQIIKRSLARLMAVQILYQKDFINLDQEINKIKNDIVENYVLDYSQDISSYKNKIDEKFLDNLIFGVLQVCDTLDKEITNNLKEGWKLNDIDNILQQILRCAIFELKYIKNIPEKVVIDEYVSISASFFDKKKVTFVNAVLDKVAKNMINKQ